MSAGSLLCRVALAAVALPLTQVPASSTPGPFVFTERSAPARAGHAMIFDARRRRWLLIGGADGFSHAEIWQVIPGDPPQWLRLTSERGGPLPLHEFASAYDSVGDRVLVFGGTRDQTCSIPDSLWSLDLATLGWRCIEPAGPRPSGRVGASLVLDRARNRLVLFGGGPCFDPSDELWTLSLADTGVWRRIPKHAPWPAARTYHAAALERGGDRMLLFGGLSAPTGLYSGRSDSWELRLEDTPGWDSISAASPAPDAFHGHALVAIPPLGEILLVGGRRDYPHWTSDTTWAYSSSDRAWRIVETVTGGPRQNACIAAASDPVTGAVLAHGGSINATSLSYVAHEIWRFDPGAGHWSRSFEDPIPSFEPTGALSTPIVLDPRNRRMIAVTGAQAWSRELREDVSWRRIPTTGDPPLGLSGQAAVLDTSRNRLLVVGGMRDNGTPWPSACDTLWALSLGEAPHWTSEKLLAPAGFFVDRSTAVLDARRDRVLLVGGTPHLAVTTYSLQLWQLALEGTPRVEPVAPVDSTDTPNWWQYLPGATIDPVRDRLLIFGGGTGGEILTYSDLLWAFDLRGGSGWQRLDPAGPRPHASCAAALAYDATTDRLLLFGGVNVGIFNIGAHEYDVFTLDLDAPYFWNKVTNVVAAPYDSRGGPLLTDPDADRFWTWDGATVRTLEWPVQDVREPATTRVDVSQYGVAVRWSFGPGADFTAQAERCLARGMPWMRVGTVRTLPCGDVLLLDMAAVTGSQVGYRLVVERAHTPRVVGETWAIAAAHAPLRILGVRPSPFLGQGAVELTVPADGELRFQLYDLAGRRVSDKVLSLSAGSHVIPMTWPERLKPGLYLLRVSDGRASATGRIVVVR